MKNKQVKQMIANSLTSKWGVYGRLDQPFRRLSDFDCLWGGMDMQNYVVSFYGIKITESFMP